MQTACQSSTPQTRSAAQAWLPIYTLFTMTYCMMLSGALLRMPVWGCALAVYGRIATLYDQIYSGNAKAWMPAYLHRLRPVLLFLALVLGVLLMVVAPGPTENASSWMLLGLVFLIAVRGIWSMRALRDHGAAHLWGVQGVAAVLALALLWRMEDGRGWAFAGYLMSAFLESFALLRNGDTLAPGAEPPLGVSKQLYDIGAYRSYQHIHLFIQMALQTTQMMIYAFIGVTYEQMVACMLLTLLCTAFAYRATDCVLRRTLAHTPEATHVLLAGLVLWIIGLLQFAVRWQPMQTVGWSVYLALALCANGAAVCTTSLACMDRDMDAVATFGVGEAVQSALRQLHTAEHAYATLIGQLVALLGMVSWCVVFGRSTLPRSLESLRASFRTTMILPALLLAAHAVHCVLRYPLTRRYVKKLRTYLQLRQHGEGNEPLEKQLERVVLMRSAKRYGLKLLATIARPFYYHRIMGKENVVYGEEGTGIFLCNHGELYGPIVTNLYVPFSFRPWVMSQMASPECVADYVYTFSLKRQRWMPECTKRPVSRLLAPMLIWVMRSIECIPVYRGKPSELRATFRDTVAAMQAGDNILIFPENPDAESLAIPGYMHQGVGEFSTGFAMLGQLFYTTTKKCATFIPVYASRHKRTLCFGRCTMFDPTKGFADERDRLLQYVHDEMARMAVEMGDM